MTVPSLRKDPVRDEVKWGLAVGKFWVPFIEHFECWDGTMYFALIVSGNPHIMFSFYS